MPGMLDSLKSLFGGQPNAPAPMDPTMKAVLAQNPQALPSEIYGQLHGQRTSDINLPEGSMDAAKRRLQIILQTLKQS